jgi:hypothetical protein
MVQYQPAWSPLPVAEWGPTYDTLHMYAQIVGKIRMTLSPRMNHWWHVPLYVTARGFTTSPIPSGARSFQADFDFFDHALHVDTSTGERATVPLGGPCASSTGTPWRRSTARRRRPDLRPCEGSSTRSLRPG